jgi:hypothetical protein
MSRLRIRRRRWGDWSRLLIADLFCAADCEEKRYQISINI